MNIVYNCNERFAVHTAVSLVSLFENNRDAGPIDVFILGNGLSKKSVERFRSIAPTVNVLDLENYESVLELYLGDQFSTGSFDRTILARLFAPAHLPDRAERYLYLDADTVVTGSLKELWETELAGKICAMAAEPTIYPETKAGIGLGEADPYFNSGMMLVDRIAWEKEKITGQCLDYFRSLGGRGLAFPDQDILNHVLKGRILPVWQGYNFFSNYHYQSYRSLTGRAPWYAGIMTEKAYEDAQRAPHMVHFAGAERPWYRGNRNPYREEYEQYLERSPWKGTEKETGHENEMRLYHWMNLLTQYCPPARAWISSVYYHRKLQKKGH